MDLHFRYSLGKDNRFSFRIGNSTSRPAEPETVRSGYPPFGVVERRYNAASGIAGEMEWIEEAKCEEA